MMARIDDLIEHSDWRPSADTVGWLSVSLVLVVVPHLARTPFWVGLTFIVVVGWRWWGLHRGLWVPGRMLTLLLAAAAVLAVVLHYRTLLGRDAGVALLTVLAAMKLLETREARDAYVTVFLAFFLVVTNFLYSQNIASGLYMVLVTVVTVATMISIQHPACEMSGKARLRLAGSLVAQALPVMIVLFVLFPRIPGPLWGLPDDAHGVTGLSETMRPGDISSLSQSSAVAFRVAFDGAPPDPSQMYWRGPVLERTDGRTWRRRRGAEAVSLEELSQGAGQSIGYEVTLEPTQERWIFALEMPQSLALRFVVNVMGEMRVGTPIRERIRYEARSSVNYRFVESTPGGLAPAQQLPHLWHPRARRLGQQWAIELRHPRAIVARALEYFATEPFVYTLEPPRLDGDSVDEFLFLTRQGFCEHYAAAFTVLMRAAGLPARVVTGYQGGEWNEVGEYWIVRQRDAHAWSEVWMRGRGWVRVDPTAAVAPTRIDRGIDVVMPESASDALLGLVPGDPGTHLWRRLRLGWDAVNDRWNQWVLSYGPRTQQGLLNKLGLDVKDWRQIGLALMVAVMGCFALVALWTLGRREPRDGVAAAYATFCAKLARLGIERAANEGPMDFARRVSDELPHLHGEVERITALYVAARYASDAAATDPLQEAVKRFLPRRQVA